VALKPRHAKFVAEYVRTSNATQSYLDAGYKTTRRTAEVQSSKLLRNPEIAAAIARVRENAAKAAEMDQQWVLKKLREVAERCLQAEPVLDKDGKPTGEFTFNASGANRALELIGKQQGMFADRLKISEEADLDDDELAARIAALAQSRREAPASPTAH
jgi:phage terminase small subunit